MVRASPGARVAAHLSCATIQYIFQNPYGSLNPRKNVRELLEQPLKQFGLHRSTDAYPSCSNRCRYHLDMLDGIHPSSAVESGNA